MKTIAAEYAVIKNLIIPYALAGRYNFAVNFDELLPKIVFESEDDCRYIANSLPARNVQFSLS